MEGKMTVKKSLIIYASMTGHTEKVALRFKKVLEKKGYQCDTLKVDEKVDYRSIPSPFNCDEYDFICAGSYVQMQKPSPKVIEVFMSNPQSAHYFPGGHKPKDPFDPKLRTHSKLFLAPECRKGIVFVTYAGHEFGPPEAEPSLGLLALEMEHLKYKCIGRFSCPGKFGDPSKGYYKNLNDRPSERDLIKAEIFLEELLEEYCDCW